MTDRRAWLLLIIALVLLAAIPSAAVAQTRFVFANESPYDTMDPHAAFDVGRVAVRLNLYDGLYRWLDNPPKLEPWLAESHTVSARRAHVHVQAPPRSEVPRRHGDHGRGRALLRRAHPRPQEGRGVAPVHDDRAGQHQGPRPLHGLVHARQAGRDLPGRGARGARGERRAPQEEREGRRLGRDLAHEQRRRLGLVPALALRPRRRLHRQAVPRPLHAVGGRSTSTRSSSGWSRKTTRACSA